MVEGAALVLVPAVTVYKHISTQSILSIWQSEVSRLSIVPTTPAAQLAQVFLQVCIVDQSALGAYAWVFSPRVLGRGEAICLPPRSDWEKREVAIAVYLWRARRRCAGIKSRARARAYCYCSFFQIVTQG